MPDFNKDIPLFPRASYEVDVSWGYVEKHLAWLREGYHLDLDPPFQRAHVWTQAQQSAYVEYQLRGGEVGKVLIFNCAGWSRLTKAKGRIEIVDGKQRLEAVRAFLRDEVPAFGHLRSAWTGKMREVNAGFKFRVVELRTRKELYELYLNINAGGTPHTQAELDKVRAMLAEEMRDG